MTGARKQIRAIRTCWHLVRHPLARHQAPLSKAQDRPPGMGEGCSRRVFLMASGILLLAAAVRVGFWASRKPYWFADSSMYLEASLVLEPPWDRPLGYPAFISLAASVTDSLDSVVLAQHLLALLSAAMLFRIARRRLGMSPPASLLLLVAVALSPRSVLYAQYILSETVFSFLVIAFLVVISAGGPPTVRRVALAGTLLAATASVRLVGLSLVPLGVAWVLLRKARTRLFVAYLLTFGLPLVSYCGLYQAKHGEFSLASFDGWSLFGLVSRFFDCGALRESPTKSILCKHPRIYAEGRSGDFFMWSGDSPAWDLANKVGGPVRANAELRSVSWQTIAAFPGAYLAAVAEEIAQFAGNLDSPPGSERFYWF